MKKTWLLGIIFLLALDSFSQCLSDVQKLVPEGSPSTFDVYGNTVAINGDWAVVGAPRNDSVGYDAGAVYIYKNISGTWTKHAVLVSPSPQDFGGFGRSIDLTDDYLVVGSAEERLDASEGIVVIYRKPFSGWASGMHPVATLKIPGAAKLGYTVKINPAGTAIVVSDTQHMATSQSGKYPSGAVYVFRRGGSEWNDASPHLPIFPDPEKLYFYFGIGLDIDDDYIFIGCDSYMGAVGGAIDVFKASDDWASVQHMATLQTDDEPGYVSYAGIYFAAKDGRVAAMGNRHEQGIFVYVFEKGSEWESETESYRIRLESGDAISLPMGVTLTEDRIFAAASNRGKHDRIYTIPKTGGTYRDAPVTALTVDQRDVWAGAFGKEMATDGNNLIIGDPYSIRRKRSSGIAFILPVATALKLEDAQVITENITTTIDHNFGTGFLMKDDYLFVGATGDGHNAALGAVSIYKKQSGQWIYQTKIAPPFNITPDGRFGYSIAANDEYIAITAPLYDLGGAVFIYRKRSSWADLELVQTLPAFTDGELRYTMGYDVAISANTMVVSAHEENQFKSTILFYKLENGEFRPDGAIPVGNSVGSHRREISFSFHDETLAAGCITSNPRGNLLPGYVFIFEKDLRNKWDTVSMVAFTDATNAFGYSVKLTRDHLFVSDVTFPSGGVWGSGAVVVYTRPRAGWRSQPYHFEPASIIAAQNPVEGDLFGNYIDVKGNILIAGAPQSTILINPLRENTNPGSTYVVQGIDFGWTNTIELLRYQGDFHLNADRFGSVVSTNGDDFVIGAMHESPPGKINSGAVYVIGMPPSVQLFNPVCEDGPPLPLQGYPYGGIWSGPGVDPSSSVFDPAVAGTGKHLLTYITPNCHYEGKLQIEVKGRPQIQWLDDEHLKLCEGQQKEVLLRVSAPGSDNIYQWLYQAPAEPEYTPLHVLGPSHSISKPGSYRVSVNNGGCIGLSPERVVEMESNPITTLDLPVDCGAKTLQLNAQPSGGSWTGPAVTASGEINATTLSNGTYSATYRYSTSNACAFEKNSQFTINTPEIPRVSVVGTLCDFSGANLTIINQKDLTYSYYLSVSGQEDQLLAQDFRKWNHETSIPGSYYVIADDGECPVASQSVVVNTPIGELTLLVPEDAPCYGTEAHISILNGSPFEVFDWWYKANENAPPVRLDTKASPFTISKSGYYMAENHVKACVSSSPWEQINFTAADSMLVPNVFTPNEDGINDQFEVVFHAESKQSDQSLVVFNRYGTKVHESINTLVWDGDNYPGGVYFFVFSYRDCAGRKVSHKGIVHMLRP